MAAAFLVLLLFPAGVRGQSALTLQWNADPNPDVAGYQVSYGTQFGVYTTTLDAGAATTCTVTGLSLGQWYYFAVRAYDGAGTAGPYSADVPGFTTSLVSLASDQASPFAAGTPVAWTTTLPSGSPPVEQEFWVSTSGSWTIGQAYSSATSFTWTPGIADLGQHQVMVRARQPGATAPYEAQTVSAPFLVGAPGSPDLTISKTHGGAFTRGQAGAIYTITVANEGTGPTSGTVTVTDALPAGLTASAIEGAQWTCTLAGLTCTRSDSLAAQGSYPAIMVTVNVATDAPGTVTNSATVSGGGDATPADDTASDVTTIGSAPSGLVAAYSFDAGSGTTVTDVSGNGNVGTLVGATWTTGGRYGNGLSFDGNGYLDLRNPPALRLTGSMTWSAWVYTTGTPADDGQIVAKSGEGSGAAGWQFKTSPDTGPHTFGVAVSSDGSAHTQRYSTTVRALNTWYYVAGVYDAAARTLHIYVNGVLDDGTLVGTVPGSQFDPAENVTIGRRTGGFYFQGAIDELRIYDRALTAAEIRADMSTPLGEAAADTAPPTAPGALAAQAASGTQVDLSWAAATDNVGVAGYRVEGCAGIGCSSFAEVAAPSGTTLSDAGLSCATTYRYRVRAVDAAGNLGPYSPIATATTPAGADTQAPSAPGPVTAAAASSSASDVSWGAATDNVGVTAYRVERCEGGGCAAFVQVSTPSATACTDTDLASGTTYRYRIRAEDAAGNLGPYSNVADVTTPATPPGLVAAYSFDAGSGTIVEDVSGNGNAGKIVKAAWTSAGRYGNALSFNGRSSYVNLGNPAGLYLTGSMTWSAWVYATGTPADDGQIIAKSGGSKGNRGWQLKTSPDTGPHTFGVAVSSDGNTSTQRYSATIRALNTWYYVAGVYNATARTLDIYVNGVLDNGELVGTVPASQFDSPKDVMIGRRAGGFYFQGVIDEVRVYDRALRASEIQLDMNTPLASLSAGAAAPSTVAVLAADGENGPAAATGLAALGTTTAPPPDRAYARAWLSVRWLPVP